MITAARGGVHLVRRGTQTGGMTAGVVAGRSKGLGESDVRVLGPSPDGGECVSMSARQFFSSLDLVPERARAVVSTAEGVGRLRSRLLPTALVADPALARTVLTRPSGFGQGRGIQALALTLGQGLLTSTGELHRRQRRLVQPAFHARRLAAYSRDAVELGSARSAAWHDGQRVDVAAEMSSLTLEVVGRTLFGADVRDEVETVSRAQNALLPTFPALLTARGMVAVRFPGRLRRTLRRESAVLDGVVERVVAARRASGDAGDVVSLLLAVRDEETGEPMPARQVRDEVLTLLLAGHETTAVALSWAWFELGRTPSARSALDAELASPAAREALAEGAWERLPVTRAVVTETLRLHPPAFMLGRRPTEDVTLGPYRFRRGSAVLIAPYALHRDERSWGPDAEEFRPARWLTDDGRFDETAPGQPRGAYLPFGAGTRMCIGAGFAVMEGVLLLARLAADWRVEFEPGFTPDVRPAVTLRTGPLPATLRALR
jgi:cytochrome P450